MTILVVVPCITMYIFSLSCSSTKITGLVEGYTLAEIKRTKEEEESKEAQSSETTGKEEDNNESETTRPDIIEQDNVRLI